MFTHGVDITSVSTTPDHGLGQIPMASNGKIYKYVLYNDGTANLDLVAGDVVIYVDDSGYSANTVTADVSDSTGVEIGAGVVVTTVTVDASYMWIQIKGAATLSLDPGGSVGDGDALTAVAAADKALTLALEADTAAKYVSVVAIAVDDTAKEIICDFPF